VRHVNAAADSGLLAAQLAYPGIAGQQYMTAEAIARDARGFDEYRSTSMRYLREAASSGSVDALITMSSVLSEGLLTDRDPIAAYAYLYAADRTGLIPSTSTSLQLLAEGLSSEDVIRARAAGEQVYAQCCQ
jgi:TPR repeat protein